jgi:uncharacterized membrane protein (DUF2068 family)
MERDKDRGLRVIITYKALRAAGALALSVVCAIASIGRVNEPLSAFLARIHTHATTAWSLRFADLIVTASSPRHLRILIVALAVDSALTALEAWSLHRRWWWGPWLVVGATTSLLPFEVVGLVRHRALGRVALLGANVLVAAYLARGALRRRDA